MNLLFALPANSAFVFLLVRSLAFRSLQLCIVPWGMGSYLVLSFFMLLSLPLSRCFSLMSKEFIKGCNDSLIVPGPDPIEVFQHR